MISAVSTGRSQELLCDSIMSSAGRELHAKADKWFLDLMRSERDHLGGVSRSGPTLSAERSAFKLSIGGILVYGSYNLLVWSCYLTPSSETDLALSELLVPPAKLRLARDGLLAGSITSNPGYPI